MRIAHSLISRLQPGSNFGIPLSRMGSIADNGSWKIYAYRMSRATVNAGTKSLTIDWKPNGIAVAILHPGYFRTSSYQSFCCLLFLDISNWKKLLIFIEYWNSKYTFRYDQWKWKHWGYAVCYQSCRSHGWCNNEKLWRWSHSMVNSARFRFEANCIILYNI